jgi:predicted site-specific integrase-resolvase
MNYVKLSKAVELTGLHPNTLRKYANEGKIETIRTPYNQRLFNCESFLSESTPTKIILYCRVSSSKQRKDLDNQIASMVSLYPQAEVLKDFGSGLNYKRKFLSHIVFGSLESKELLREEILEWLDNSPVLSQEDSQ